MMNKLRRITLMAALLIAACTANAQRVALKTNVPLWATGTVNFSGEFAVHPRITLDLTASSNLPGVIYFGDKALNRKIWQWTVQPEARWWFAEAFNRGFVGFHAGGGSFDTGGITLPFGLYPDWALHRYEGWFAGAGFSLGWQWVLSPHWNFEATVGAGYRYVVYNRFASPPSFVMDEEATVKHWVGPTKFGLSFSYLFRSKKSPR
jgi:hypothetical protein